MRLFIAINLPVAAKEQLADLQNEIKNSFPMEAAGAVAKWVEPENLHLTLLFLGEAGERDVPRLVAIIQEIAQNQAPLVLRMKKICYGPDKKIPPRLIWVELEESQPLKAMAGDLQGRCLGGKLNRGIGDKTGEGEGRGFVGHITLARIKEWVWKRIEPEEQPEIEKELDMKIEVRSIELMESRLKRSGPEYLILQSFPLLGID